MSKEIKEQNVRVDIKVPVTVAIKGKTPDGTKCKVVFRREGTDGTSEEIETLEEEIKKNELSFLWVAKGKKDGGLKDNEVSAVVHCEIQIEGKKPGSASDYLQFRVWAADFTVKILNAEDNDKVFDNSVFRVKYPSGHKTLRFAPNNDGNDGMELALAEYSDPELSIVHPYEIVGQWTLKAGRVYEAKAKKKKFKAIFKDTPGASEEEGKYKRRQYVNIENGTKYNEGHRIKIDVAPDAPVTGSPDVYMEITFSAAGGNRSKRDEPVPTLINADSGEVMTTYKKKLPLHGKFATFEIELGLAGGDVCTVKIGATDKCEDGELVITNWRRIGFNLFLPAPSISDFGKLGDGSEGQLTDEQMSQIAKELEGSFIEYDCVKVHTYDATGVAVIQHLMVDGKLVGRAAGKKAVWCDDDTLKDVVNPKLKSLLPNEFDKPYYHNAIVVDRLLEKEKDGLVTVQMSSASMEVKLHSTDNYAFPTFLNKNKKEDTGIRELSMRLTKLNGKVLTDEDRKDESHALHYWMRSTADQKDLKKATKAVDTQFIFSLGLDYARKKTLQDQHVEFLDPTKIKLKFPDNTAAGAIFKNYKGVEFEVTITYAKFKDAEAMGMSLSSGLIVFPSKDCYTGILVGLSNQSIVSTIIHELWHSIDFSYLGPQAPDGKGNINPSNHKIPGMDYRKQVPAGYAYDGHGHAGGHCAFGVGDSMRDKPSYDSKLYAFTPKCICWGAGVFKLVDLHVCDECAEYARAQDLRDFSKLD